MGCPHPISLQKIVSILWFILSSSSEYHSKVFITAIHSLVYPHLIYGILTWGSTNNSVRHPLQVLQNRLMRIISRVKKNSHIANNSVYHKLNILKIKDIYHLEMAKFMYLYHNNKLPKLFNQYFSVSLEL